MAPKPLRGALAFLLVAILALPARPMDVVLPGEVGKPGTGQGQAGSVGGLTPGVSGGVSVVPNLGLGLAPALGPGQVPAPLVNAAADPVFSAKPLAWAEPAVAAAAKPAAVLPAAAKPAETKKLFAKPSPPAIDAPS